MKRVRGLIAVFLVLAMMLLVRNAQEQKQLTMVEKTNDSGVGYRAVLHYNDSTDLLEKITVSSVNGGDVEGFEEYYYSYDSGNRLVKAETSSKYENTYRRLELSYDDAGRIAAWVEKYADEEAVRYACEYDGQGRLVKCSGKYDIITYTYDARNRVTNKRVSPAAGVTDRRGHNVTYRYDGDIVYSTLTEDSGISSASSYSYAYPSFVKEGAGYYEGYNNLPMMFEWHYDLGLIEGVSDDVVRTMMRYVSPTYIGFEYYPYNVESNDAQITCEEDGAVSKAVITYGGGISGVENTTVKYYYDGEEPEIPADTNEAAYAAYISVVEQAKRDTEETISLSAAEEYGIANGYLADLDRDGIDEMVLSYCDEELMGEPGGTWYLGFTVYSVYDYENGQVKTVVDKERIVGHVAAMYGYAAVIEVDGKAMVMVTDEISDGTGSGTTHRYRYQFYEYPSMQTGLLLEHKEEQWSGGTDTFYVNDAVVSRNSFINELNRCSGLELGTYGVTYTDDPMTLTELQAYLK